MNYELLVQLESARQILLQLFFWLEVAIMMVSILQGSKWLNLHRPRP